MTKDDGVELVDLENLTTLESTISLMYGCSILEENIAQSLTLKRSKKQQQDLIKLNLII